MTNGTGAPSSGESSNESARTRQTPTQAWLYTRYAPKVGRHVQHVLGTDNDHEDIVHEVMIRVFLKIGTLRNLRCLDAWVREVTVNTLRYVMRQRRARRHPSLEDVSEQNLPSFQTDVDARELAGRTMDIVERLPPKDQALLSNLWFSGFTASMIAEKSGCSVMTIRRRLFRARARFEKLARRDRALLPRLQRAGANPAVVRHPDRLEEQRVRDPDWLEAPSTSSAA